MGLRRWTPFADLRRKRPVVLLVAAHLGCELEARTHAGPRVELGSWSSRYLVGSVRVDPTVSILWNLDGIATDPGRLCPQASGAELKLLCQRKVG